MTAVLERSATIPVGLCQCGCGHPTVIADKTDRRYGTVAGQPRQFVPGHNSRLTRARRVGPPADAPAGTRRCTLCGYPMVPSRAQLPGKGWCRHAARGLCSTCCSTARNDGTVVDHERAYRSRDDVLDDWTVLRQAGVRRRDAARRLGLSPYGLYAHIAAGRRDGDPRAVLGTP